MSKKHKRHNKEGYPSSPCQKGRHDTSRRDFPPRRVKKRCDEEGEPSSSCCVVPAKNKIKIS
jgi:hypothetical protein